ncbi:hypothetical protein AMATHDRAFT_47602 [Amanita thiersii Skay4041]|uniref:Uncharacterized protein n=1 Tax=Amanita thiersii Skay4041 TaxID=703135 RepID=A0A2A9NL22_9AGAR|nr:hypothetical protein AMATHDRAFT_47602 [Amanita thiersii Skay4041]
MPEVPPLSQPTPKESSSVSTCWRNERHPSRTRSHVTLAFASIARVGHAFDEPYIVFPPAWKWSCLGRFGKGLIPIFRRLLLRNWAPLRVPVTFLNGDLVFDFDRSFMFSPTPLDMYTDRRAILASADSVDIQEVGE